MFKAYQILYKKVGVYQAKLDHFDKLASSQLISEDKNETIIGGPKIYDEYCK